MGTWPATRLDPKVVTWSLPLECTTLQGMFHSEIPVSSRFFQITILDDAVLSVKGGSPTTDNRYGGAGGVIQIIGSCGEIRHGSSMNTMKGKSDCSHQSEPAGDGFMIITGIPKGEFAPAVVYKPTGVLSCPPPEIDQIHQGLIRSPLTLELIVRR